MPFETRRSRSVGCAAKSRDSTECFIRQHPQETDRVGSVYGLAILPLALGGFEQHISPPDGVLTAEQSRSIAATPAKVWARLLSTESNRPEEMDAAWDQVKLAEKAANK